MPSSTNTLLQGQQILTCLRWCLEIGTREKSTMRLLLCMSIWYPPTLAPPLHPFIPPGTPHPSVYNVPLLLNVYFLKLTLYPNKMFHLSSLQRRNFNGRFFTNPANFQIMENRDLMIFFRHALGTTTEQKYIHPSKLSISHPYGPSYLRYFLSVSRPGLLCFMCTFLENSLVDSSSYSISWRRPSSSSTCLVILTYTVVKIFFPLCHSDPLLGLEVQSFYLPCPVIDCSAFH